MAARPRPVIFSPHTLLYFYNAFIYHLLNHSTDQWLETYTKANPRRSAYAFCINPKYPGYFYLCFKAGENSRLQNWLVKVIPQGFELQKNPYPDMQALCNGFKLMFSNMQSRRR